MFVNLRTNKILATLFVFAEILGIRMIAVAADVPLQVADVRPLQTNAKADGTFGSGWKWLFNVTVPTNETLLQMKFSDWMSSSTTIPVAGNMKFFSPQSIDADNEAHALVVASSDVYSPAMTLDPALDLDASSTGNQIEITVEMRIPTGTASGIYGTNFGIMTTSTAIVPPMPSSTDASLASLTISTGTLSPVFSSSTFDYTVVLPAYTTSTPIVSAATNDPNATSTIRQATSTTGIALVLVAAQDASTTATYRVSFSLAPPNVVAVRRLGKAVTQETWLPLASTTLPATIGVTLDTGTTTTVPVVWAPDTIPTYASTSGIYALPGTLVIPLGLTNTYNLTSTLAISVFSF